MIALAGAVSHIVLNLRRFEVRPFVQVGRAQIEYDLSARVMSMHQNASLDNPTMSLQVTLDRGSGSSSLSPFIAASTLRVDLGPFGQLPIMDPNMQVTAGFEVRDPDIGFGDTIITFVGRLDRVNASDSEQVTILCRDMGGYYANAFLERVTTQGSANGVAVEDVIRSIVRVAFTGSDGSFLEVPSSPGYQILAYPQEEMSLLEAGRILAQQIGWDFRFFASTWIRHGGDSYLRLYDPGRTRVLPDLTLTPNRYEKVTELAVGDEDVRNKWEVWWPDATAPIMVRDIDSVARYGVRYARISLDRTANIRSSAAAQTLADSALADSKQPFASHAIQRPILPQVELGDLHTYEANGREYDTDFTGAVVAFTHRYEAGHATTTVGVRQQAIAAYREYRSSTFPKTIMSAIDPPADFYAPEGTRWVRGTLPALV